MRGEPVKESWLHGSLQPESLAASPASSVTPAADGGAAIVSAAMAAIAAATHADADADRHRGTGRLALIHHRGWRAADDDDIVGIADRLRFGALGRIGVDLLGRRHIDLLRLQLRRGLRTARTHV